MAKLVAALFDQFDQARQAVDALQNAGFEQDDINLIANNVGERVNVIELRNTSEANTTQAMLNSKEMKAKKKARKREMPAEQIDEQDKLVGTGVSGGTGSMMNTKTATIGGIGKVLASGPILNKMESPGFGMSSGIFINSLMQDGVPEDKANIFAEGLRRGGTFVSVGAGDHQAEQAADILNHYNPVDIERRSQRWEMNEDWQFFDRNAVPYSAEKIDKLRTLDQQDIHQPSDYRDVYVGKAEQRRSIKRG